ncbi:hypothetical protein AUEXF2481DRAFT_48266 [Aureobasidium subglaciale EXF-2481]|uniref:Uncharacterized protein n=1 Tax=Aureobasidium subglaciale (strain EXF-2481) TaxID=1043005 RepID=A0A074Y124_AURSE|nr:uncharacterized protein AUEXF2481DRAFT_48266 [Aureobasidium subglaciale EXF-2481]KEQ91435.1 hypothetical protein AUEXF2481DRAFT_48266 [Aureobasidium subglaciale EXF-2481]
MPTFTVKPLPQEAGKKTNFGAIVDGMEPGNIDGNLDLKALRDTIWANKVIVVKGQKDLLPIQQWELVTRFDPDAPQVHSHGDVKTFNKNGGILSASREVLGIPGAENVRLIGKCYQGADHYGIKDRTITKPLTHDWHATKLFDDDFENGHTRFQRWHMDAPLYERDPAWFTTLRCIKRPTSPTLAIHWDDGSGLKIDTEPGLTAFFRNKAIADHSWVEYAPYPYKWMGKCRGNPNGLDVASEGLEASAEDLGEWKDEHVKRYPMVWLNPVTGEKAFQVIDDVVKIRAWVKAIQGRILRPEYIMLPKVEEGDVIIWADWQCFHSAIDYPSKYGPRTMHQANIGAFLAPIGPVPVPAN